jgi:hypothetical protein
MSAAAQRGPTETNVGTAANEGAQASASMAAVPVSVADPETASSEAAASVSKALRPAEAARLEAPMLAPQINSAASPAASADSAPLQTVQATSPSAPAAPSAVDINAALDRLVAAREALMPAATALAVDHAEFGEVTIRFEQSTDGRLSAELAAADPDLRRAVTAAVAADRGMSSGAESDGGRSAGTGNPRGSLGSGEAANGERQQRGNDRDMNSRAPAGRQRSEPGSAASQTGVFA